MARRKKKTSKEKPIDRKDMERIEFLLKKKDLTAEEQKEIEAFVVENEAKTEALLKKKPAWLPDEKSTYGEILEFKAVTMPYKHQQFIEIYDEMANGLDELAKHMEDPKQKKEWQQKADHFRKQANEMRQENQLIRKTADSALKDLDDLL